MYNTTGKNQYLANQIIREEYKEIKQLLSKDILESKADEILNISYFVGGYDQNALRRITVDVKKENDANRIAAIDIQNCRQY